MAQSHQSARIIRAAQIQQIKDRSYNKPVNIQSNFKEAPDVLSLFQGEAFNNNPLMKELAQLQIMYQFVCEENVALKSKLGFLAESLRGIKDREQLTLQLMRYHDEIMSLKKQVGTLETKNKDLMFRYGDQEFEKQKKDIEHLKEKIKEGMG